MLLHGLGAGPGTASGTVRVLTSPDEAGRIANADIAGLVLGAKVPVILTSRADSVRSRIASCAVAVLSAHARRQQLGS